jgi:hypothetical protein
LGTELETIPAPQHYLSADAARRAVWAQRLGIRALPRIGIVWSGKPTHTNDLNRSIPLAALTPILQRKAEWIGLQKAIRDSDRGALGAAEGPLTLGEKLGDFADAAALIEELDLVITVDTAIAHLAGAVGKRVWILLPCVSDWRWLQGRTDSPWYPTARLFRQSTPRDWSGVLERLADALNEFLAVPPETVSPGVRSLTDSPPVTLGSGFGTERLQ